MLKEVCYMTSSFLAICFLHDSVIVLREHLKPSICQKHYVCFRTLVVAICYDKRSAFDSRHLKGMFI